ncbi:MAG TPA: type II secretion system F family protein [Candidatus Bathyarchaeia archaeon]|nr:type II secretion system F family protein [Candidatus Bathyarchaeia archaeon]
MTPLLIAICVAVVLFAGSALLILVIAGDQSGVEARLAEVTTYEAPPVEAGVQGLLSQLSRLMLPFRRLLGQKGDEELAYRLGVAGFRNPGDVETFLNAKLLCPIVGVLIATFAGRDNALPLGLVLAAAGYFAPDLYLIRATAKRKREIALSLPDALDLLVMCMEAGLGMDQAMLRVATENLKSAPALSQELLIISREQRAGRPRGDAWRSMAERVDLDTIRQFASMLTQSEKLGTPIATALGQFADALRTKRLLEAEEQAAKTTIKLVFPLVLFIFPSMFIVILGPVVIAFTDAF